MNRGVASNRNALILRLPSKKTGRRRPPVVWCGTGDAQLLGVVANAYRDAFAGLSKPVWVLSAVTLVNRSGTMVLPFLTLYLTSQQQQTATQAGMALSVYGLGAVAGSYLGGWLCDVLNPITVQALSLLLTGGAFLVLKSMDSGSAIIVTLLVLSLVNEAFRPANAASLSALSTPSNRVRAFALNRLAVNLGMTVGPVVGGFLATIDYGWLFLADAVTCFLAAGLLWGFFRPKAAGEHPVEHPPTVRDGSLWRDRPFLALFAMSTVLGMVFFQSLVTFPLTLRNQYAFAEYQIGLVLAVNTVIIVLLEMVTTHVLAQRNPLKIVGVGCFLVCLGFALLPLGSGFTFVAATVAVWTVGEMLSMPFTAAFVANRAGPKNQGRYMGMYTLSFSLACVIGPLLGTWVYQQFGPKTLWYGCGVVGVLLWAGYYGLNRVIARERSTKFHEGFEEPRR